MKTIRETEHIRVIVLDESEEGGACHEYETREVKEDEFGVSTHYAQIKFQKGPIKENGVNDCQIEDLLAICIHRIEGFQSGNFACADNQLALTCIQGALTSLNKRTKHRQNRGVEGKNQK